MSLPRTYYPVARGFLQVIFEGVEDGPGSESQPLAVPVLAKSMTVHKNSYREPDTFQLELDALDAPFDPDLVRTGSVELYAYDAKGIVKDAQVISRQTPTTETTYRDLNGAEGQEVKLDAAKRARDEFVNYEGEPLIAGLIDECRASHDSSGRWVTIVGQDYTALLAQKQWPPMPGGRARRIPTGQRLDDWLDGILHGMRDVTGVDPTGVLKVLVEGVEVRSLPKVGGGMIAGMGRGIAIEQNTTYWDVITKTVQRHGFIVFVRGLNVVIARPKNIDNEDLPSAQIKRFAWGENIESIQLSRKMGKEKCPRIVVQGWDPSTRTILTESWPPGREKEAAAVHQKNTAKEVTKIKAATAKKAPVKKNPAPKPVVTTDEFKVVPMYGVSNRETLRRAAQNMFHLLGRGERSVVIKTSDLTDADGRDLFKLEAGDAVLADWNGYDTTIPPSNRFEYLLAKGMQAQVAQCLANNWDRMVQAKRPMRLKEATIEYDCETGVSFEMELQDFATVTGLRYEPSKPKTMRAHKAAAGQKATGRR